MPDLRSSILESLEGTQQLSPTVDRTEQKAIPEGFKKVLEKMTSKDFVKSVKLVVLGGAIRDFLRTMEHPVAWAADPSEVELAEWFGRLPTDKRELITKAVQIAADQATYNFLLVLDGALAIEGLGEKGELELFFHKGSNRVRLNDPVEEELNSLYKED